MRESIAFLLDRQPATTFGEQLSLDELPDRHPEYIDEVRARLGNA